MSAGEPLTLRIAALEADGPGIRTVTLIGVAGARLASFAPGAHIVLDAGGRHNAYSLTGPGHRPRAYSISVLRVPEGQGGSRWVHEHARVGELISASRPHNLFAPVATATRGLLIAGGIGITPILAHARELARWGRDFELILGHRPGRAPLARQVATLSGGSVTLIETGRADLMTAITLALRRQPLGTHLWVCGPEGLIGAVTNAAHEAGWPPERVHFERFAAPESGPDRPFTAVLASSGRRVEVPAGTSLLEALDAALEPEARVPRMCRHGVCGQCRLEVLSGLIEHRDLFLSPQERLAGRSMMCCVSRADERVVLDL